MNAEDEPRLPRLACAIDWCNASTLLEMPQDGWAILDIRVDGKNVTIWLCPFHWRNMTEWMRHALGALTSPDRGQP